MQIIVIRAPSEAAVHVDISLFPCYRHQVLAPASAGAHYRNFYGNFSTIVHPLPGLLSPNMDLVWTPESTIQRVTFHANS